ncbi:hypothetical protein [Lapillicoccus sp.]|uniref:hypothetical protein n=1 Tax=Lapillicoccus sp. TaxID=1909287 RepID=UPI00326647AD
MKITRARTATTVFCTLAAAVLLAQPASAKDGQGPTPTDGTAAAQQLQLEPLRAVADALGDQGRTAFADTYANLALNSDTNTVTLYVTSLPRGVHLVAAAKAANPSIDTGVVRVVKAKFTKQHVDATIARIMGSKSLESGYSIISAAAAPDGSGVQVVSSDPRADGGNTPSATTADAQAWRAAAQTALGGDVDLTIAAGSPITPTQWRWNDTVPFIGGDVALGTGVRSGYRDQCTTGLAAENSAGSDYITVAAHCFPNGSNVYGEGDATGNFGYNYGHYIGRVVSVNTHWDAALVYTGRSGGAGSNSDEADQPTGRWYRVNSYAYSYNGDLVCQDGARSYYTGHGVPCGIKVINQDITYNESWDNGAVYSVRGVEGYASSGYAVRAGDSGALVFTVTGSSTRQARGQVSAQTDSAHMFWTEAPDVFGAFSVHLNPHQ